MPFVNFFVYVIHPISLYLLQLRGAQLTQQMIGTRDSNQSSVLNQNLTQSIGHTIQVRI